MKLQFLNEQDDCQWLAETHLRGLNPPAFLSFEIEGNEDCPTALRLHGSAVPIYTDAPVASYKLQDDGSYLRD